MKVYFALVALALGAAACTITPTNPVGSVTVTTATPVSPANGAQIANLAQPVTLVVNNPIVTGDTTAVVLSFEVATDAGFLNKVVVKDVTQTPGQTSLKLDPLTAGKDYYWHVRTTGGDTVGTFTTPIRFTIGAAISIAAPTPANPANGTTVAAWPTLTVTNALRSGPVGSIVYRYDVSTRSDFGTIALTATLPEGVSQSQDVIPASTPAPTQTTQYFWRAFAIDQASGVTSPASVTQSFTFAPATTQQAKLALQEGFVLWPGTVPPGTNGHAKMGDNWQLQTLVSHGGTVFTSPTLDALRIFDLLDRGFVGQDACDWMHANGYPQAGAFFTTANGVFGFDFMYMSFNPSAGGTWDLVLRSE